MSQRSSLTIRPGVTFIFGQTYTGKTTLMRRELEKMKDRRALIFDPSCSEALDGIPELTSRDQCKRFLTTKQSAGSWIRVARFSNSDDYCWLAGTARFWRGVIWVLDDGRAMMELDAVAKMAALAAIQGRHFGARAGVGLWFVGHRPMDAGPTIRAQVACVYTFRQREKRDLELLAQWCGFDFASKIPQLKDRSWLMWPEAEPVAQPGRKLRNSKRRIAK